MAKIYDILEVTGFEPLASDPTPAFKGRAYYNTTLSQVRLYDGASWTVIGGGGGGVATWIITGSHTAPSLITAAGGVGRLGTPNELRYIQGNAGAIDVTAVPQIPAGNAEGDILELMGTSNANTVLLEDGTGLSLNGAWLAEDHKTLSLRWSAADTLWVERFRS